MKRIMILVLAGLMAAPVLWAEKKTAPEQASEMIKKAIEKQDLKAFEIKGEQIVKRNLKGEIGWEKSKFFPVKNPIKRSIRERIFESPDKKYFAVDIYLEEIGSQDEKGAYEYNDDWVLPRRYFYILDEKGKARFQKEWEYKNYDEYASDHFDVFLTAEDRVLFGYLDKGHIEGYTIDGKQLFKKQISDWTWKRQPVGESEGEARSAVSKNGKYIAATRYSWIPGTEKSELTLFDNGGNVIWQTVEEGIVIHYVDISSSGEYLIAMKDIGRLQAYKNGDLLWETEFTNSSPRIKPGFIEGESKIKIERKYGKRDGNRRETGEIGTKRFIFKTETGELLLKEEE